MKQVYFTDPKGKQRFELSGALVAHNEQLKKKLDL
jgi:hypothetical protein